MKSPNSISIQQDKDIGIIKFCNQPNNPIDDNFFNALKEVITFLKREKIKAAIFLGEGRHFSSGADLDQLLYGQNDSNLFNSKLTANRLIFEELFKIDIPIIASINGVCIGAGLELAFMANYRICGEGATLGLPEASFHLIPGLGGIEGMIANCGYSSAIVNCLTGDLYSAYDAFKIGMVDLVLPKKEVFDFSLEFARNLPQNFDREYKKIYLRNFYSQSR